MPYEVGPPIAKFESVGDAFRSTSQRSLWPTLFSSLTQLPAGYGPPGAGSVFDRHFPDLPGVAGRLLLPAARVILTLPILSESPRQNPPHLRVWLIPGNGFQHPPGVSLPFDNEDPLPD